VTTTADSGSTFRAVVTNTAGTVTSAAASPTCECGSGGANDHDATGESDGDGGTDGELRSGSGRNRAAELSMAKTGQTSPGDGSELHDAGDDNGG